MGLRAASPRPPVQGKTEPKKTERFFRAPRPDLHRPAVCQPKYRAKGRLATRGWYTESGKYFIATNNPNKLYSWWGADPPRPTSLYVKSWEWLSGLFWTTWTPRVQFLPRKDTWTRGEAYEEYKKAAARHAQGSFIFGKNDCQFFANTLSSMITEELNLHPDERTLKGQKQLAAFQGVGVGTYMRHIFDKDSDCVHHAATVVAADGRDLVTLEADVSKPLLTPTFQIRTGLIGFVRDNDPDRLIGSDEVYVHIKDQSEIAFNRKNAEVIVDFPHKVESIDNMLISSLVATTLK